MPSEHRHAQLLLAILRRRWDTAQSLADAGPIDTELLIKLCWECEVVSWIHEVLEQHQRWSVVGDQVRKRLTAARKKIARDNLLLLARLEQALDGLLAAGVEPILLKGGDVLHRFYPSFDTRMLVDIDVLVSREQLKPALAALLAAGWTPPAEPERTHYIRGSHHLPLHGPGPVNVECELHWNVAQEGRYRVDVEGMFQRSLPLEVSGRKVRRLEDHDFVAHLLIHHFSHYFARRLKNLVDLEFVAQSPGFSWARVVETIRRWKGATPAAISLRHIRHLWPELIPDRVCQELHVAWWRRALAWPLRVTHPLDFYRNTSRRWVQLYLAGVMLEDATELPGWVLHRSRRDQRQGTNPLDEPTPEI